MDVNGQLSPFAESLVLSSALAVHCYRGNVKQYVRFYHVIGTQQMHEVLHSKRNLTKTGLYKYTKNEKQGQRTEKTTRATLPVLTSIYAPFDQEGQSTSHFQFRDDFYIHFTNFPFLAIKFHLLRLMTFSSHILYDMPGLASHTIV